MTLALMISACSSNDGPDPLIKRNERFTKILANFDRKVGTCTTKFDRAKHPFLNWKAALFNAGKGIGWNGDRMLSLPSNSVLGSQFQDEGLSPDLQREYAVQIEDVPVVIAKVLKIQDGSGTGVQWEGEESAGFTSGTAEVRMVAFDPAGEPVCELTVTVHNSKQIFAAANATSRAMVAKDFAGALRADLERRISFDPQAAIFAAPTASED